MRVHPHTPVFGDVSKDRSVHFVGIGGIGVSSLARWFLAQKWAVSGSDIVKGEITKDLEKQGLKVKIGHKKGNIGPKTGLVVYSNAIRSDNPEVIEARRRGIPTLSYPEALGALTREYTAITVSGAHGKSTTTSLLSLVLIKAGMDPTVIVGTKLKEFVPPARGSNFRFGKSEYLVLEADEWKAAFLHYSPSLAIITNIDKEHLDFYKNLSNIKKTFLRFIGNVRSGGVLVVNRDSKELYGLRPRIMKIARAHRLKVMWYSVAGSPTAFTRKVRANFSIPGAHNISNACAVYTLAHHLKIRDEVIFSALKRYRGAWRRFEYRGVLKISNFKLKIYDDYAHHPTEIKVTLQAFREKFPKSHLICVFEPHQAKRLRSLFREFAGAFKGADTLILLPIYRVAGRDRINPRYTSEALAKKIKGATYLHNKKNLLHAIRAVISKNFKFQISNYVVIMMGAGTIVEETDKLLRNE